MYEREIRTLKDLCTAEMRQANELRQRIDYYKILLKQTDERVGDIRKSIAALESVPLERALVQNIPEPEHLRSSFVIDKPTKPKTIEDMHKQWVYDKDGNASPKTTNIIRGVDMGSIPSFSSLNPYDPVPDLESMLKLWEELREGKRNQENEEDGKDK